MDYQELVENLLSLPGQIADVEASTASIKQAAKMDKQLLERRETEIIVARADWGKNDKERKTNQEKDFFADAKWSTLNRSIFTAENSIAQEEVEATRLRNLFYAYRSIAELTAAQMLGGRSVASAGNGQAIVDATADEIGL